MTQPVLIPGFSGIDNVHKSRDDEFQLREGGLPTLVAAVDVDIDDGGHLSSRAGYAQQTAATTEQKLAWSLNGMLIRQDGGSIFVDANETVTGLSADALVLGKVHDDAFWWVNGETRGMIDSSGTARSWGVDVPPSPDVSASGNVLLTATQFDADGIESGAPVAVQFEPGGTANVSVTGPEIAGVHFYATTQEGTRPYLAKTVTVGNLPATITESDVRSSVTELETFNMRPPPGLNGVATYKDLLLVWDDDWIYPSTHSMHLFNPIGMSLASGDAEVFRATGTIQAVEGLETGIWVATTVGLYWYSGDSVGSMKRQTKGKSSCAKGSALVNGSDFPFLETSEEVAVFLSESGLVFGLPGGVAFHATRNRYKVASIASKRATFAMNPQASFTQLVVVLDG